jgi:hypothetical protein
VIPKPRRHDHGRGERHRPRRSPLLRPHRPGRAVRFRALLREDWRQGCRARSCLPTPELPSPFWHSAVTSLVLLHDHRSHRSQRGQRLVPAAHCPLAIDRVRLPGRRVAKWARSSPYFTPGEGTDADALAAARHLLTTPQGYEPCTQTSRLHQRPRPHPRRPHRHRRGRHRRPDHRRRPCRGPRARRARYRGRRPGRAAAAARLPGRARARGAGGAGADPVRPDRADPEDEYLGGSGVRGRASGAEWITGGGWSMEAFEGGTPTAEPCSTRSYRTGRCICPTGTTTAPGSTAGPSNSPASRGTPDPVDGRIERDATANRPARSRRARCSWSAAGATGHPGRPTRRAAAGPAASALARHHRLAGRAGRRVPGDGRPVGRVPPPPGTARSPRGSSARCGGTGSAAPSRSPNWSSGGRVEPRGGFRATA